MGKLLFDLFPTVLFFVTYFRYEDQHEGLLIATAVLVGAVCLQVGVSWLRHRRIERTHLVILVVAVVLGGLTLALGQGIFIKWKTTAVYWTLGGGLLAARYIWKRNLIQQAMGSALVLPPPVWSKLNLMWAGFFLFLGALNLGVIYNFNTDTWMKFKLFGVTGLLVVFAILQGIYVMRAAPQSFAETGEATASTPDAPNAPAIPSTQGSGVDEASPDPSRVPPPDAKARKTHGA